MKIRWSTFGILGLLLLSLNLVIPTWWSCLIGQDRFVFRWETWEPIPMLISMTGLWLFGCFSLWCSIRR